MPWVCISTRRGSDLNPPETALVLSCDEKSPIQALDRTQKSLPLFPGRLKTLTHDYKRHGTTTLFAAIELAQGRIIADCLPQHRHQEWITFLKKVDAETPSNLDLHLIVDNDATHKHPNVVKRLKRHRRFHIHFPPISSSWLNAIERWFRDITQDRIRNGVFRRVAERVLQRRRIGTGNPRLHCTPQRPPENTRLDQESRGHPHQSRPRSVRTQ